MTEFIVTNNEDFDTSEGYFGKANFNNNIITIPYINMGLLPEHSLNKSSCQRFVSFSYLQIINPEYISVFEKGCILNNNHDISKSKYFGGLFVGGSSEIDNEFEVQADAILLILPSNFKISKKLWIPEIEGFEEKETIDKKSMNTFFQETKNIKKGVWCY
ncbi:hypothetical protein ACJD0Z_04295 [Flavobacteriaceae bacterium M23B6Z8]